MPRYVFIRGGAVAEVRVYEPALDPAEIKVHPIDGLLLRPIINIIDPPLDPLTEVREGPTYLLRPDDADEIFTIRPMTQAELDVIAAVAAERSRRGALVADAPGNVNSVPALRAKVNEMARFLREEFGFQTRP